MHTYVKVLGTSSTCFYALVDCNENKLVLKSFQGLNKPMREEIDVNQLTNLTKDTFWGGQRISFYYQEKLYQFYECGPAVIDYLQEKLFEISHV